jgi:hypothetical protein
MIMAHPVASDKGLFNWQRYTGKITEALHGNLRRSTDP